VHAASSCGHIAGNNEHRNVIAAKPSRKNRSPLAKRCLRAAPTATHHPTSPTSHHDFAAAYGRSPNRSSLHLQVGFPGRHGRARRSGPTPTDSSPCARHQISGTPRFLRCVLRFVILMKWRRQSRCDSMTTRNERCVRWKGTVALSRRGAFRSGAESEMGDSLRPR
jgi:hypothetical protein